MSELRDKLKNYGCSNCGWSAGPCHIRKIRKSLPIELTNLTYLCDTCRQLARENKIVPISIDQQVEKYRAKARARQEVLISTLERRMGPPRTKPLVERRVENRVEPKLSPLDKIDRSKLRSKEPELDPVAQNPESTPEAKKSSLREVIVHFLETTPGQISSWLKEFGEP